MFKNPLERSLTNHNQNKYTHFPQLKDKEDQIEK